MKFFVGLTTAASGVTIIASLIAVGMIFQVRKISLGMKNFKNFVGHQFSS